MSNAVINEAVNKKALEQAQQRAADLSAVLLKTEAKMSGQYAESDLKKLLKIKTDLSNAQQTNTQELFARQALQEAYNKSTYPNKNADPVVIEQQKAVAKLQKMNLPKIYQGKQGVNQVCQPCVNKALDKINDCNTPYFVKYGKGGGPVYNNCGQYLASNYLGWAELIKQGIKTPSEQDVLIKMSQNEGEWTRCRRMTTRCCH